MSRALARRLVLLVALLLLPGSAWARVQYLCHMSGRVQSTCCCKAREKVEAPSAAPVARSTDCCDRLTPAEGAKATTARLAVDSVPTAALAAVVPVALYLAPSTPAPDFVTRQSRGPPGAKRPLFAVHCAYLC